MLCYKVLSYQHWPMSGAPKQPNEALQTTFQSTKTIRGLPKGVWPTFEKSKILTIFTQPNGWVGKCAKETSPGHLLNNTRANQTSKWTITYPTNDNQSHLGAFRHIRPTLKNQNFWLFGHWVVGCSEVNYELLSRSPRLKPSDIIWMDSVEPEYEVSDVKDGRVQIDPRHKPYHYLRES